MASKRQRRPTKEDIAIMNREQMKELAITTITGSIIGILEQCIEQRVSQWFDVIVESLEKKT